MCVFLFVCSQMCGVYLCIHGVNGFACGVLCVYVHGLSVCVCVCACVCVCEPARMCVCACECVCIVYMHVCIRARTVYVHLLKPYFQ